MYQNNVDWPIVLDACYFNINAVSVYVQHYTNPLRFPEYLVKLNLR